MLFRVPLLPFALCFETTKKSIVAGPKAASYLQSLTSFDLSELTFGKSAFVPIEGYNLHVARGGYTGEDGFEVLSDSLLLFLCKTDDVLDNILDLNTAAAPPGHRRHVIETSCPTHGPGGSG